MTSVFDGMTAVLADVFGAAVKVNRPGQSELTVKAVFRELPVEQEAADGRTFVTVSPTLRLAKSEKVLAAGDQVIPSTAGGRKFRVVQSFPGSSPAEDAFVTYVLEEERA